MKPTGGTFSIFDIFFKFINYWNNNAKQYVLGLHQFAFYNYNNLTPNNIFGHRIYIPITIKLKGLDIHFTSLGTEARKIAIYTDYNFTPRNRIVASPVLNNNNIWNPNIALGGGRFYWFCVLPSANIEVYTIDRNNVYNINPYYNACIQVNYNYVAGFPNTFPNNFGNYNIYAHYPLFTMRI